MAVARWSEDDLLHYTRKRKAAKATPPAPTKLLDRFCELCIAHGLPAPEVEVEGLIEARKFRVDYLFRPERIVIECNGQIWKKGGHSSGTGLLRDYEKLNMLQAAGYRVFQYTPDQLARGDCLPLLKAILVGV